MKRKVNRVGQNTLTVSLPSFWVRKAGLAAGDELELLEQGGDLLIRPGGGIAWGKTVIDIHKFGFFHQNFLSNVYHLGFDEVEVHFKEEGEFRNIRDRLPNFIGFEIVDQGENSCLIKDISQTSELEFDNVLRRTFLLLIEMSEKCEDAIRNKQYRRLRELRLLEAMNNKFTDYCRRVLNKKGYVDPKKTNIVYALVHDLERIADEYKRMCDDLSEEKKSINPKLLDKFTEINKYLRMYYELFYKYDKKKLAKIFSEGKEITDFLQEFIGSGNKQDALLAHHLTYITIAIYDLSYTYIETVL